MSKRVVAVCGAFDPYLHIGHLEHIRLASQLGDKLIVILNPDADVFRKRGAVFTSMGQRYEMLKANRYVDEIVISIDGDNTVAKTLLWIKPQIFAKGGDRRSNADMPANEVEVCKQIGCEIVYGVGEALDSGTEILKRIIQYKGELFHKPSGGDFA